MKLVPFGTAALNSGTQFSRHLCLRASCPVNWLSRVRSRVHSPRHIAKTIPNLSCGKFSDPTKSERRRALVCAHRCPWDGTVRCLVPESCDAEPFQARCHDRRNANANHCAMFSLLFSVLWVTGPRAMRRNLCLGTFLHRVHVKSQNLPNHVCRPWICRENALRACAVSLTIATT